MNSQWAIPQLSWRFRHIWQRNSLVWRKLAIPSMLGNLADPLLYMLGLGYGLGRMLETVDGISYIGFLASGIICSSTMMSASFETMYSGFSRMHIQKTWETLLNAPLTLDDVVLGELIWAASKSFLSGCAVLIVATALGLVPSWLAVIVLPVILLTGLAFSSLGLIMTALSPSYDFFMYYFTLGVTPMMLLCGVFFPLEQLPLFAQQLAQCLPLTHAVSLVRPLVHGMVPTHYFLNIAVLSLYTVIGFYLALACTRRRLLQ